MLWIGRRPKITILIATSRPKRGSRARYTSPIPPQVRKEFRKGRLVPEARAINGCTSLWGISQNLVGRWRVVS
jgi:hypothetical protein